MNPEPMRQTFLEKLSLVKKELTSRFPDTDMRHLTETLGKLAHNQYSKKAILLGETKELHQFLIGKGYNTYTVYRWLLLERLPEDIKYQIKQKQISQRKAVSVAHTRKYETMEELNEDIRNMALSLIRRM